MDRIKELLLGNLSMDLFLQQIENDETLQQAIRNLIPVEAQNNPEHPLWVKYSYATSKEYKFDLLKQLQGRNRFDRSIEDNLNIFGTIQHLYMWQNPNIQCTTLYRDAFGVYLSAVGDWYGGPEVDHLVDSCIQSVLCIRNKNQRIKEAKQKIKSLFHTEGGNIPRWIQGAEWPMGQSTPMAFITRKRKQESVLYFFQDVETEEVRVVEQFY